MKFSKKTRSDLLAEIEALKEKNNLLERKLLKKTKQSSKRDEFNKIFSNAPIPISIINKNGKTEYINKIFKDTFGYTLRDIPIKRDFLR